MFTTSYEGAQLKDLKLEIFVYEKKYSNAS